MWLLGRLAPDPKATADIRSLARAQTALAIRTLTGVCGSKAAPAAARVSASRIVVRCPVLMP